MKTPLPNEILNYHSRLFPELWKRLDIFRHQEKEAGNTWDPRVFLPINLWYKFFRQCYRDRCKAMVDSIVPAMVNLGAWRPTQDIIVYDGDMYGELVKTSLKGRLPSMLAHLPAWSLYFEAPGLELTGISFDGFFAATQVSDDCEQYFLCLSFVNSDFLHFPVTIPLGDWTLEEAVAMWNVQSLNYFTSHGQERTEEYILRSEPGLHHALNLIIFLFSHSFNGASADAATVFTRSEPKKAKGIPRLFPPARPRIRLLGADFGEIFRRFKQMPRGGDRSLPSPHIRRAHWHTYRYGSMKIKERPVRIKWLPPIPVALGNAPEEVLDEIGETALPA